VISKGELILVEDKNVLMQKLGKKQLTLNLTEPMRAIPSELSEWALELAGEGNELVYSFDSNAERTGIPSLLRRMSDMGIGFKDLHTRESSLEDIFVNLVSDRSASDYAIKGEAR
jgi:ABC-2 type transport system ATP-binding protein